MRWTSNPLGDASRPNRQTSSAVAAHRGRLKDTESKILAEIYSRLKAKGVESLTKSTGSRARSTESLQDQSISAA
jgi:hypothetical protein